MKHIYKYPILSSGMKFSAPFVKILDIQYQNGIPTMWVIVDDNKPDLTFTVNVLGTGWEFDRIPGEYISTLQDESGYVWHFFLDATEDEASLSELIHSLFVSQAALLS